MIEMDRLQNTTHYCAHGGGVSRVVSDDLNLESD